MTTRQPVHVRGHTWIVLTIGSVAGLAMFLWPLLISPPAGTAHNAEAPFIFVVILPLVIAVILAELSGGGLDLAGGRHGRGLPRQQVSDEIARRSPCQTGRSQYRRRVVTTHAQRDPHAA